MEVFLQILVKTFAETSVKIDVKTPQIHVKTTIKAYLNYVEIFLETPFQTPVGPLWKSLCYSFKTLQ